MSFILFIYFLLGTATGILSGLLGIGGGVIVVPALAYIFKHEHFSEPLVMHMAVGTSLSIMVATTLRSLKSHLAYKGRREFWAIAKQLFWAVGIGVIGGALLADVLHSDILRIFFGVFVLLIALRMFLMRRPKEQKPQLPPTWWVRVAGLVMGGLSGLIGIGGGTTVIPYLLHHQVSMRIAVRVSIFVGLIVAVVGAVMYFLSGLNEPGLPPHSLGYIYWPAWVGTAVGSVLFAPLGVRLSYYLPSWVLRRIFACFLIVIGIHMFF